MSRPNQALPLGFSRASWRTAALGSTLVNRDGQAAMSRNRPMRNTETQKIGFFFSERHASEARDRASSVPVVTEVSAETSSAAASVMADPRVEHAVQQVDDEVNEQEDEDQDGHGADDVDRVPV